MMTSTRLAVLLLAVWRGVASAEEVTAEEDDALTTIVRHGGLLEDFDRALLSLPDSVILRVGRAETLFLQGDVGAAKGELKQLVKRHAGSFFACNDLLSILLSMGDADGAKRTLQMAKEAGIPAYLKEEYAAFECELNGDLKRAEAILKQAAAGDGGSASEGLVEFYARNGRFGDAIATIDRLIGPRPWDSGRVGRRQRDRTLYFEKGAYSLAMNRLDDAYAIFEDIFLKKATNLPTIPEVQYSYMLATIMSKALGYQSIKVRANLESTTRSRMKSGSRLSVRVRFSARVLGAFLGIEPEQVLQELTAVRKKCPLFPGAERAGILLSCFFLMKANEAKEGSVSPDVVRRLLISFGKAEQILVRLNWIRVCQ